MSTENLGDDKRPIIRIDNTVHRPAEWWTPAVHELLNHLESVGFKYSPRVLGFDNEGREVLSYIAGESGKDSWKKVTTDDGLRKFAHLLRSYHDAVADFKPSSEMEWACSSKDLKSDEIICHGDFGPWNVVWQGNEPVGIVDWDLAVPAQPQYDVLYALEYAAPFRDDKTTLKWHHFSELPDRKHRIEVFKEAYGIADIGSVVDGVANVQRTVATYVEQLASRGLQPQVDWVADGVVAEAENQAKWTEAHRELFE